jgi:hypothetical protein
MGVLFGTSVIVPIGIVLKKVGDAIPTWEDFDLPASWRALVDSQHLTARHSFREALDVLRPALDGFDDSTPVQLRIHTLSHYARVLNASGGPFNDETLRPIRDSLDDFAALGIFDGTSLHNCATALHFQGDHQTSADLYWACMMSPSMNIVLAMRIGLAYVRSMKELGKFRTAVCAYAVVVRDLTANYAVARDVVSYLQGALDWACSINYFDDEEMGIIRQAIANELNHCSAELGRMFAHVANTIHGG